MRDDWWLEVRTMLEGGEKEKEVTFSLPANEKELLKRYDAKNDKIKCRLAAVELADGSTEVLCTSILDKKALPYECFAGLYHLRWNIEEGYKLFSAEYN